MNIKFKRVILKNFLSFGDADIDLQDKGYCLVSGINQNPKDNALSNGSGKSSWSSAICWALTGETTQGLTNGIKNINVDENLCYVTLFFKVDNDEYEITRYKEPKSDLKVIINGKDESGKGIRESELVLAKRLPDLTSQLVASIIILGQGLPCKFSSNTPSGRKDVLEKLSKSDFMIQDLKDRISKRAIALSESLRKIDDTLLVLNTNKTTIESNITKLEQKLLELNKTIDYSTEITALQNSIIAEEKIAKQLEKDITDKNNEYTLINDKITSLVTEKSNELAQDTEDYNSYYQLYLNKKSEFTSKQKVLEDKISSIKNIKTVCPTCGRPFEGVVKPSTETEEKELLQLKEDYNLFQTKHNTNVEEHNKQVSNINMKYKIKLDDLNKSLLQVKQDLAKLHSTTGLDISELKGRLAKLQADQANHNQIVSETEASLNDAKNTLKTLNDELLYNNNEKGSVSEHINIVNKMNTLVKRDFRGFLLKNIINFIDKKAKEYSKDIFGTDELDFTLDGNNINISYCNKSFEGLSGGEKQKVDLIIQFAIRDMMSSYLNFSSNIIILDEIFDNLDATGCTNIINLISRKLNDIESIFIISHHADELAIPNDTEMVIIKNELGISRLK